jgi:hypothetical protein
MIPSSHALISCFYLTCHYYMPWYCALTTFLSIHALNTCLSGMPFGNMPLRHAVEACLYAMLLKHIFKKCVYLWDMFSTYAFKPANFRLKAYWACKWRLRQKWQLPSKGVKPCRWDLRHASTPCFQDMSFKKCLFRFKAYWAWKWRFRQKCQLPSKGVIRLLSLYLWDMSSTYAYKTCLRSMSKEHASKLMPFKDAFKPCFSIIFF